MVKKLHNVIKSYIYFLVKNIKKTADFCGDFWLGQLDSNQ